jgi:hypothetical protein
VRAEYGWNRVRFCLNFLPLSYAVHHRAYLAFAHWTVQCCDCRRQRKSFSGRVVLGSIIELMIPPESSRNYYDYVESKTCWCVLSNIGLLSLDSGVVHVDTPLKVSVEATMNITKLPLHTIVSEVCN